MHLVDTPEGARILFRPTAPAAVALLRAAGVPDGASGRPELEVTFRPERVYNWVDATEEVYSVKRGTRSRPSPLRTRLTLSASRSNWS